jgi:hypothetical protein
LVKRCAQASGPPFERRQWSPAHKLANVPVLHRNVELMVAHIPDRNGEFAELFLNPREAVQKAPAPQGFVNEGKWIGFALLPASGRSQPFLHQVLTELKEELLPGVEAVLAANLV